MGQSATFGARIKLRIGREQDYNPSSIPLRGEACLIAYENNNQIGAKIGDGVTSFSNLGVQFLGVITGYYYENRFYYDAAFLAPISNFLNTLYIDKIKNQTYYYDGEKYVKLSIAPMATPDEPGIMKLYESAGVNIDGTMTQKAISDRLSDIDVDTDILTIDYGVYN